MLWKHWWKLVCQLRPACSRTRTFLWMVTVLAGMTIRPDLLGVTSLVRALGLLPASYDRLLDFFHSSALNLDALTGLWRRLVFTLHPGILRVQGRPSFRRERRQGRPWQEGRLGGRNVRGHPGYRQRSPDR